MSEETKNEPVLDDEKTLPPPVETEFYEILGVPIDATSSQIKKAYFLKARKCHPDKNPNNPEAEEEFKKLSVAYEVLYDPELRETYHRSGKGGVENGANFGDPRAIFAMLFGGGKFNNVFGELSFFSADESQSNEDYEKELNERVEHLKNALVEKLKPWMEGRAKLFIQSIQEEVEELKKESYGAEILQHIGYIYVNEAKQHLKGFLGLPGIAAEIREKAHIVKELFGVLNQAAKTAVLEDMLNTATEQERLEIESDLHRESIVTMWRIARMDMEAAVRLACEAVMEDPEIDKSSRKRRCQGIQTIGKIWRKTCPEPGKEGAWQFLAEMETQFNQKADSVNESKWQAAWKPTNRKALPAPKEFI